MPPALLFFGYLLACVIFTLAATLWPLARRETYSPVHLIALGLALVTLVWTVQAAQAAF